MKVLKLYDTETGELALERAFTDAEESMSGYIESVIKGYWGTRWMSSLEEA